MSQIFSIHEKELCEFCNEEKIEIGVNCYICTSCSSREDNF